MTNTQNIKHVVVIGAGYCGLAASYELAKAGHRVTLIEADENVGGLAGTFKIRKDLELEKFYHHWFTSDQGILTFLKDLNLDHKLKYLSSRTGLHYANTIFRLSSPLDLLRFKPLSLINRLRTGLLPIVARRIQDWTGLENVSAFDWVKKVAGEESFNIIWKPLLIGKFGSYAEQVSAVWLWNKLKLRGSSRNKKGSEELVYFEGGFGNLNNAIEAKLKELGVKIILSTCVDKIESLPSPSVKINNDETISADIVLSTIPLPAFLKTYSRIDEGKKLDYSAIPFLGNICLILEMTKSLSEMYWLNITDPDFPFVGIIEHTRLDNDKRYGGKHFVYLSKYLDTNGKLFSFSKEELLEYSIPYIRKMFPDFDDSQISESYLWKSEYSQPVVVKNYSNLIPPHNMNHGIWLATMAQIYPQDRGTNYAILDGRKVAKMILNEIG